MLSPVLRLPAAVTAGLLALAGVAAVGACSASDGRQLPPPKATVTTATTVTTAPPSQDIIGGAGDGAVVTA
jgi:hypothetical protein